MDKQSLGVGPLKKLLRQVQQRVSGALRTSGPEVRSEAFLKALKPIERRKSEMTSTSRGRGWWPRRISYREHKLPGTTLAVLMPAQGYTVDWHGSLRRTAAKVNKCRKRRAAACAA